MGAGPILSRSPANSHVAAGKNANCYPIGRAKQQFRRGIGGIVRSSELSGPQARQGGRLKGKAVLGLSHPTELLLHAILSREPPLL